MISKIRGTKCLKSMNEIKGRRKCMVVLKFLKNIEGAVPPAFSKLRLCIDMLPQFLFATEGMAPPLWYLQRFNFEWELVGHCTYNGFYMYQVPLFKFKNV